MMHIYFQGQGYDVAVAPCGEEALELCQQQLPHVIMLDIMMPDIDGYTVCQRLRNDLRTSRIPIIFVTQKDERSDKIYGLELGADDYVTKPFDLEELGLRVKNTLTRAAYENLTHPATGLPGDQLIGDQLGQLMRRDDWALLYIGINHLGPFCDKEGFLAGYEVLRDLANMLGETVDEFGTCNDFISHQGDEDFVVITTSERGPVIRDLIIARFNKTVGTHYTFVDRQNRCITVEGQQYPLMSLAVGMISPANGPFHDVREIMDVAAESRGIHYGRTCS